MPAKPKTGGKSYKKKANTDSLARDLVYKGESEVYGVCTKVLGCGYYTIYCLDGVRRRCHLRGALKKRRVMMHAGDLVLVSLREFSTETDADIVHKYQPDEVKELKKYGEITVDLDEILDRRLRYSRSTRRIPSALERLIAMWRHPRRKTTLIVMKSMIYSHGSCKLNLFPRCLVLTSMMRSAQTRSICAWLHICVTQQGQRKMC